MRISDLSSDVCSSDLGFLSLEVGNEILQPAGRDGIPQPGHELLIVMQIVTALQDRTKHLLGLDKMMQVGEAVVGAGRPGEVRSEERRQGQACVRKCGCRWWPYH